MMDTNCLLYIQSRMGDFSKAEKKIAAFILDHPAESVNPSIDDLADLCKVSEATLFRFVRKLGFESYQQFRIALAMETEGSKKIRPGESADDEHWINRVFQLNIETLEKTMRELDSASVEKAIDLMISAGQVNIFGLGGSGVIAQDAYSKFIRIGIRCLAPLDYHFQTITVSHMREGDVALLFVHNGVNPDAILLAQKIHKTGRPMIFVTNYKESPIVKLATVSLFSTPSASMYTFDRQSVRIALYSIVDCLYQGLTNRMGDAAGAGLKRMYEAMMKNEPNVWEEKDG